MRKTAAKFAPIMLFLISVNIAGCGEEAEKTTTLSPPNHSQRQLPWSTKEINAMNTLPNIKNSELGIELPPNCRTDWKVQESNGKKYITFYQDPHKKGNPPYQVETSPSLERLLFISDFDKVDSSDKFAGFWVGKIYEYAPGGIRTDIGNVQYGDDHKFSVIAIKKIAGKYEASLTNMVVKGTPEPEIDRWEKQGLKALDVLLSEKCIMTQEINLHSEVETDENSITVTFTKNGTQEAHMVFLHHKENDTLELIKFETSPKNKGEGYFYNFGVTERHDILKRYTTSKGVSEVLAALIQLKMDAFRDTHSDISGYRDLMLGFPHRKYLR